MGDKVDKDDRVIGMEIFHKHTESTDKEKNFPDFDNISGVWKRTPPSFPCPKRAGRGLRRL
jgi:hypothetical protein